MTFKEQEQITKEILDDQQIDFGNTCYMPEYKEFLYVVTGEVILRNVTTASGKDLSL